MSTHVRFGSAFVGLVAAASAGATMVALSQDASAVDSFTIVTPPEVGVSADAREYTLTADGATTIAVDAAIADSDGWADVSTVKACLYAEGADSECSTPEPASNVSMTYQHFDDSFAVHAGDSAWWHDAGSTAIGQSAEHGVVHFVFGISPVAAAGNWHVKVVATDDHGSTGSQAACSENKSSCFEPTFSSYASVNASSAGVGSGGVSLSPGAVTPSVGAGRIVANVPVSLRVQVAPGSVQSTSQPLVVCGAGTKRGSIVTFNVAPTTEAGIANPAASCSVSVNPVGNAWNRERTLPGLAVSAIT